MPQYTPETQAFIAHWKSLRTAADGIPSSRDFLDHASPALQPYVSFNDIGLDGQHTVSLHGTGLVEQWGTDLTGQCISARFDRTIVQRFTRNLDKCLNRPCGMWEISEFATSTGRVITKEICSLPLSLAASAIRRFVRFHVLIEKLEAVETVQGLLTPIQRDWIDVGAGVPVVPPEMAPATRALAS